jgi:hypothetical protein
MTLRPLRLEFLLTLVGIALGSCARPPPSNDTVFVSNEGSNQVTIVDGATGHI